MYPKCGAFIAFIITIFFSCLGNPKIKAKNAQPNIVTKKATASIIQLESFPIIDSLHKHLAIAGTIQHSYSESDTIDRVFENNDAIAKDLETALLDTNITKGDLVKLLSHPSLGIVHSDDKWLWIFNWYENTGGSFKSNISILLYKGGNGKYRLSSDESGGLADTENNVFQSGGAGFDSIYKLPSKHKSLYLCMGNGIGCTTCIYSNAVVVELTKNGINFNYPAFQQGMNKDDYDYTDNPSSFMLAARWGNIEEFGYNPKTRKLSYVYLTDDNTPIQREEGEEQERIERNLKFNGKEFIGKGLE